MAAIELKVPDIGDFESVEVIEVLVSVGDEIKTEQSLVTVESDKASMEIPSSASGVVKEVLVKVGDKVKEGSVVALLEEQETAAKSDASAKPDAPAKPAQAQPNDAKAQQSTELERSKPAGALASQAAVEATRPQSARPQADQSEPEPDSDTDTDTEQSAPPDSARPKSARPEALAGSPVMVEVPDIGDFDSVEVIEVLVGVGDTVALEQSLITVESDKASMEIPSSASGVVKELRVKVGDKVSKGSPVAVVAAGAARQASTPERTEPDAAQPSKAGPSVEQTSSAGAGTAPPGKDGKAPPAKEGKAAPADADGAPQAASGAQEAPASEGSDDSQQDTGTRQQPVPAEMRDDGTHAAKPHASPSVRKFARELGVDLGKVTGSGPKQRITQEDVQGWVKGAIAKTGAATSPPPASGDGGAGLGLIPWPKVDFARFGPIESKPLARIKKIAAANLHRNWVMIPHVTNHDEADVTDLEEFRIQLNKENEKSGLKLTMLAFLAKACVNALKKFPELNSSLDGDTLVFKHYYHIGFAADTPNGLVVPVVREADRKGLFDIAHETAELARKARDGKLSPADMQGGTFSISSLGGIGGTGFTPIINAPEVAILGVSRSVKRPVWDGKQFVPRLMLPLSLSYDHRVIDGALAARFNAHLVQMLGDFRRVLL
jgi:pyruvate dehydrogenase E2 component (dihydrolipoamide acetyltransferase)